MELKKRVKKLKSKLIRARMNYQRLAEMASIIPDQWFESDDSLVLSEEEFNNSVLRKIDNMKDKK